MATEANYVGNDGIARFCEDVHPRLVNVLAIWTGDRESANDLAQETLVRTWVHWSKAQRLESPAAWAFKVARNLARSKGRRRVVEQRAMTLIANTADDIEETDHANVATPTLVLIDALRRLPAKQRDVVVLRFVADLSIAETAAALGMKQGTVKSTTSRALEVLRSLLKETVE